MSIFSRFLPKRKPPEIKNNIPKEKENIRKTFGIYCGKHHEKNGSKLCPRCTALLATVFTKIDRCPYGITKPICDRCDRPCFGTKATQEFLTIMQGTQRGMLLRHPIMTIKHKLAEQSREATERIQVTLNEMNRAVEDISKSIETTGSISEEQAASTQEITANLSQVTKAADELKAYIKTLA